MIFTVLYCPHFNRGGVKVENTELVEQFKELIKNLSAEEIESVKEYIRELQNK